MSKIIFNDGKNGYRIPSMVNAGGTLVAVADKGTTGADWGYIELACRTSADGGKTWTEEQIIATPPAREISYDAENTASAFFIDPVMSVAPNGDIVMLVTFFPESKGIHNKKILDKKKVAFASFDGENVPLVYDRDGKFYYALPNGTVLNSNKEKTEYTLDFAKGELYKGDEYLGNIFLNGAIGKTEAEDKKTTFGAPLKAPKRSYVFMLKSTDKGATWSAPVDVTASVINEENDGVFFAVAPGAGATLANGRMIMPIYTLKGTVAIYSDDNGKTWRRNPQVPNAASIDEWAPVQVKNGDIYAFSRSKKFAKTPVAISKDGIAWMSTKKAGFKAPKCQKSAVAIDDKIFVCHPAGKKRTNGVISTGTFTYNKKGKFKGIKWNKPKEAIKLNDDFFAYSCMAVLNDSTIAVLFEDKPSGQITFDTISL